MSETVEAIKVQARGLSPAERVELAAFLLDSPEPDDEGDRWWGAEIARRIADIRAGTAVGRSVDDVVAELRGRPR